MVPVLFFMNAGVILEGVNIGDETAAKIVPKTWRLALVKPESIDEIVLGIAGYLDDHLPSLSNRSFASSQLDTVAVPSARRCVRSSSTA
jgi:hypothetical protein